MARILLINHYAGSPLHGMEYRPFYFAREWVKAGHRVLIVAAGFSHLRQKNPVLTSPLQRETIEGVDYLWVRTPTYRGNGLARVRNMLTFLGRLCTSCRQPIAAFAPELVIASSTYSWDNWPAAHYARRHGARYVYELHDVLTTSLIEIAHMHPRHPLIWALDQGERFACRRANKVVSLLPAARDHLVAHGMRPEKFVHITNGIVVADWQYQEAAPAGHVQALQELRRHARCLIGYVGGHGGANALDVLIEAGADPRLRDIAIVCVGDGVEKKRLEEKARALGSNVRFLAAVPRRAVPALMGLFDVLYLGWTPSPLYRFGISPNKLAEYMMAGVPVLHGVAAANDPVQEARCGLSVPPGDAAALAEGMLALANLAPEERKAMGLRGRRHAETHHSIEKLAARFLESVLDSREGAVRG